MMTMMTMMMCACLQKAVEHWHTLHHMHPFSSLCSYHGGGGGGGGDNSGDDGDDYDNDVCMPSAGCRTLPSQKWQHMV